MPPTRPLRPINPNNTCPLRITAAAGTELAGAYSMGTVILFPIKRALQPEGLLHSRGIAGSGLRPLSNIPHCCLPQEPGPYLSSNVADHPLRPATDHRLGQPLPNQLANPTQHHLIAQKITFPLGAYMVLPTVSHSYSLLPGRYLSITHPSATNRFP